jgi:hypothetical protein
MLMLYGTAKNIAQKNDLGPNNGVLMLNGMVKNIQAKHVNKA